MDMEAIEPLNAIRVNTVKELGVGISRVKVGKPYPSSIEASMVRPCLISSHLVFQVYDQNIVRDKLASLLKKKIRIDVYVCSFSYLGLPHAILSLNTAYVRKLFLPLDTNPALIRWNIFSTNTYSHLHAVQPGTNITLCSRLITYPLELQNLIRSLINGDISLMLRGFNNPINRYENYLKLDAKDVLGYYEHKMSFDVE